MKPEGNGKLSKRDGVLGDFPVFPLEWKDPATGEIARGFREDGYYPDAVVNFLAFLGWNPGTDQEIMSLDELIEAFDINHIHKAGARFDVNKAKWYNQHYLRQKPDEELANKLGLDDKNLALSLVKLMKERVTFTKEISSEVPYIFSEVSTYDQEIATKKWDDMAKNAMPEIVNILGKIETFESQNIHDALFAGLEEKGIKPGKVMQALRLAVTGEGKGPDLMLTLEILGKQKSIMRINKALEVL